MRYANLLVVGALSLSALAAPASAEVMTLKFSGSISSGEDTTGVFGLAGQSAVGQSFLAKITFETNNGTLNEQDADSYGFSNLKGVYSNSTLVTDVTMTINGVTKSFAPNWDGSIGQSINKNSGAISEGLFARAYSNQAYFTGDIYHTNLTDKSISAFSSYMAEPGTVASYKNAFQSKALTILDYNFTREVYNGSIVDGVAFDSFYEHARFGLLVGGVSAAPEPGTWAMLLLGFGGIGASLRAGRRRAIAPAA